jgi:hypothetical protein
MDKEMNEKRALRKAQLMTKNFNELCDLVLYLEEEVEKGKMYRKKLIQVRNLVTPQDQKRKQGRPTKEEEENFI